jgi:hypothetical protein
MPKEYENTVEQLEERLGTGGPDELTIEERKDKLRLKWMHINKKTEGNDDDLEDDTAKETTLAAQGFKGRCRVCGKWGHKAAVCHVKDKVQNNRNGNSNNNNRNGNSNNNNRNVNNNRNQQKQNQRFYGKCNFCHIFGN